MDNLRVLSPIRILWLNLTGSGNESAPHLADNPRVTLMWCSFGLRPLILRAYGAGRAVHRGVANWLELVALLPDQPDQPGARQIVDVAVTLVQASCGYAVPRRTYDPERPVLRDWAEAKGDAGLRDYWAERNALTLDGRPTGIEANLRPPS